MPETDGKAATVRAQESESVDTSMAGSPSILPSPNRLHLIIGDWAVPIAELALRLTAIALASDLLLRVPIPLEGTPLTLLHALIVFGAVALIGISILETLFYDHHRP